MFFLPALISTWATEVFYFQTNESGVPGGLMEVKRQVYDELLNVFWEQQYVLFIYQSHKTEIGLLCRFVSDSLLFVLGTMPFNSILANVAYNFYYLFICRIFRLSNVEGATWFLRISSKAILLTPWLFCELVGEGTVLYQEPIHSEKGQREWAAERICGVVWIFSLVFCFVFYSE